MSEENQGTSTPEGGEQTPSADERLANLQKEFARKQANSDEQMAALQNSVNNVTETLKHFQPTPAQEPPAPGLTEDDVYDPGKIKTYVEQQASTIASKQIEDFQNKFMERQNAISANEAAKNQALVALAQEYPELNQAGGDFQKGVLTALGELPEAMQNTAEGYRMAVYKQAAHTGLAPKSKREAVNAQNFALSGGSSNAPKTDTLGVDIDPAVVETAKLMGLDVTKEATLKDLAKRSERTNWNKAQDI
jgi:hypothetical protein